MELSWTHDRRDGVDLVRCRLVNDAAVPRRVRIENRLAGPVLPPRRQGVPEQGWDADGVTVRLSSHSSRALGYACVVAESESGSESESEPTDTPVAIASVERADEEMVDGSENGSSKVPARIDVAGEPGARSAVRSLRDHRPPREVIDATGEGRDLNIDDDRGPSVDDDHGPSVDDDHGPNVDDDHGPNVDDDHGPNVDDDHGPNVDDHSGLNVDESQGQTADDGQVPEPGRTTASDAEPASSTSPAEPASVEAWLNAVERRVERAERLDGADVETATEVLVAAGGLDAISDLDTRLECDADRLRTVSERAATLATRAEDPTVPTGALERLS